MAEAVLELRPPERLDDAAPLAEQRPRRAAAAARLAEAAERARRVVVAERRRLALERLVARLDGDLVQRRLAFDDDFDNGDDFFGGDGDDFFGDAFAAASSAFVTFRGAFGRRRRSPRAPPRGAA